MIALEVIGFVANVAIVGVLTTSSAAKLRSPSAFTVAMTELGLRPSRVWWFAICAVELLVAIFLLTTVVRAVAATAVAFLGVVFAASGIRGLQIDRPIECTCFGAGHASKLGWAQIFALPLWLTAAFLITWWQPNTQTEQAGVAAAALLNVLMVHAVLLVRATRSARGDRLAFAEGK